MKDVITKTTRSWRGWQPWKHRLLWVVGLLLICTIPVKAQITGPIDVCAGDQETYSVPFDPAADYCWFVDNGTPFPPTTTNTLLVQWPVAGMGTVTLVDKNTNDTLELDVTIHSKPTPEILTPPGIDCSRKDNSHNEPGKGNGDEGRKDNPCITACDSTTLHYFTLLDPNSTYQWLVTGHISFVQSNNEIDITWGDVGVGTITVIETNTVTGCVDSAYTCVEIVESPNAAFTTNYPIVGGQIDVCLGQTITFTDQSYDDIAAWDWSFGDGYISTAQNPSHTYALPGTYTVTLVAYNECGCPDTARVDVVVDALPGPEIICTGIVCAFDTVEYCTPEICSPYTWAVTGGTIITPAPYGDCIQVAWGDGSSGPGSISLDGASCVGTCALPTMVDIPIVSPAWDINGPIVLCRGETGDYSVPKVPGTKYVWKVVNQTGGANGTFVIPFTGTNAAAGQDLFEVSIQFPSSSFDLGQHIIYLEYYNDFLGCGGKSELVVDVLPDYLISGNTTLCANVINPTAFQAVTFDPTFNNVPSDWTVIGPGGSVVFNHFGDPFFGPYDWSAGAGNYILIAKPSPGTGPYCEDSALAFITVIDPPPPPAGPYGPDALCPNTAGAYFVVPTVPGAFINWTITSGTGLLSTSFGPSTSVTWTGLPGTITATQTLPGVSGCESSASLTVTSLLDFTLPAITGDPTVCLSGTGCYSIPTPLIDEAAYTWAVSPATLGSIDGPATGDNICVEFVANGNVGTTAQIILFIDLCDVVQQVTYNVNLVPNPVPTISYPTPVCEGAPVTFTGTGGTTYTWSSSDGGAGTGVTFNHTFAAQGTYTVEVEAEDANGCIGVETATVQVKPSPTAAISGIVNFCPGAPVVANLVALNGTGYMFSWSTGSSTAFETILTAPTPVTLTVTNAYGCTDQASVLVAVADSCPVDTPDCIPNVGNLPDFTYGPVVGACNTLQFTETVAGSPATFVGWSFGDGGTSSATNPTHTYTVPGFYNVGLTYLYPNTLPSPPNPDSCYASEVKTITIGVVPDFYAEFDCIGGGPMVTTVFDNSTYLATMTGDWDIVSWAWDFYDDGTFEVPAGPATSATATLPAGATVDVTLVVTSSNGSMCEYTQSITVPDAATADFDWSMPTCEGEPVQFNDLSTGDIVTWDWDFINSTGTATSTDQNPIYTYDMFGTYNVTLDIEDSYGCISSVNHDVVVMDVDSDTIAYLGPLILCEGQTDTLFGPPGVSWLWSNGETTQDIIVSATGFYEVEVTLASGCSYTTEPVQVIFNPTPVPFIYGETEYCEGELIQLNTEVIYNGTVIWEYDPLPLDGIYIPAPNNITIPGYYFYQSAATLAATGNYRITVTDPVTGCTGTSAPYFIQVNPRPAPFTISTTSPGPLCEATPHVLNVDFPDPSLTYIWSTGQIGTSITVVQPGSYYAVALNEFGCTIRSNIITVYELPEVACVISGCYEICDTLLPYYVPGPAGFAYYEWIKYDAGSGTWVTHATTQNMYVTMAGMYRLVLKTFAGCMDTSNVLQIDVIGCTKCDLVEVDADEVFDPNGNNDDCCHYIDLTNNYDPNTFIGVTLYFPGGDMSFSDLDPNWSVAASTSNSVTIAPSGYVPATIPSGILNNVIKICLSNFSSVPQEVYVDWLEPGTPPKAECKDTLVFNCPIKPECLTVFNDSIYCQEEIVKYSFYIENHSNETIEAVVVNSQAISGIPVTPNPITIPPLAPGATYGPIVVCLPGTVVAGDTLCYTITAHNDSIPDSASFCCTDSIIYCIEVPDCPDCDKLSVKKKGNPFDCCYDITLNNGSGLVFSAVETEILTAGVTYNSYNAFGSGLLASPSGSTLLTWTPIGGGALPTSFTLPAVCLDPNGSDQQVMVIRWLVATATGDSVLCTDTLGFKCPSTCVGLKGDSIHCDIYGNVVYDFSFFNNAGWTIQELEFLLVSGSATFTPNPILGPIADQTITAQSVSISGAAPGDVICFKLVGHDQLGQHPHLNCCSSDSTYCITIPQCEPCEEQIVGPNTICKGDTAALCAMACCPTATYLWSNGATTDCTNVTTPGTYMVEITCDGVTTSVSHTLFNVAGPTVIAPNHSTCANAAPFSLNATPLGGTYSPLIGLNTATGVFDPSAVTPATSYIYTYTYTDPLTGCTRSDNGIIDVFPASDPCLITVNNAATNFIPGASQTVIYAGYYTPACVNLSAPVGFANYDWGSLGSGPTLYGFGVCPTTTTTYTLTVTDNNGCTSSCSVTICVIDVSCEPGTNKVAICHSQTLGNGTVVLQNLCLKPLTAAAHLASHPGDFIGYCVSPVPPCDDDELAGGGKTDAPQGAAIPMVEAVNAQVNLEAFPNPFAKKTTIKFSVPTSQNVTMEVTDLTGKKVQTLYSNNVEGGLDYMVEFDGDQLAPGLYINRLVTEDGQAYYQKLMLMK